MPNFFFAACSTVGYLQYGQLIGIVIRRQVNVECGIQGWYIGMAWKGDRDALCT